jgi:Dyp-type peroxidase family
MLELADIQGLVLSGYARQPFARYWFLDFAQKPAARWLSRVLFRVSTSERRERRGDRRVNVAFSASGLAALGLPDSALATFPRAYLDGMAAPARARALGDHGENAAEHWEFGGARGRVDALVLAYASDPEELDEESDELEDEFDRFGFDAHVEDAYLPADRRGHFGFLDARSNPRLRRSLVPRREPLLERALPPGEFLLGYRNADGHFAPSPRAPRRVSSRALPPLTDARRALDLGRNGTFVAVRKLSQDVPGFWRFAAKTGLELWPEAGERAAERVAENLVGRRLDGARLERCPLGAHVRRANPRDTLGDEPKASLALVRKHRLIRRGRLYGDKLAPAAEPDGRARGLLFMALCADLERQFEFVHEAWLHNPKFAGLSHERDPLAAWDPGAGAARDTFSVAGSPFRRTFALERFVRVRGGAYLFMPSLRALAYLAEG